MFFIQGVFFQNQEWLGVQTVPIEGNVAVLRRGLQWDMYAGIIFPNPERVHLPENKFTDEFIGGMNDHFGESTLKDIVITDLEISFSKKYNRRDDVIHYSFKIKDGNTWVGGYHGDEVGKGLSRCIITPVNDSFNDPTSIMKLLGTAVAHAW